MAKITRTYNVPLRKEFIKSPEYKRAKKAVNALRAFLQKHMKSEDVKLGKYLNQAVWARGMKHPPHHIKVIVTKEDDGKVFAELEGAPVEAKKEGKKKPAKAKAEEKKPEQLAEIVEEKKEEKEPAAKKPKAKKEPSEKKP